MARIAVGGFHHETNCFVLPKTDFAYFASHRDRPPLVRGTEVLEWLRPSSFALGGALAALEPRHEIVPLVWTSGGAGGLVTRDAFERIAGELIGRLSAALPVDAVYLDLHGAMVTEDFEDGEGELLRRVRAAVGSDVPVAISLDYHANVTPLMVGLTDGLISYLTYPHVDRRETGERAARIVETLLARGRPAGRALRKVPFLIPLNGQCTMVEPSAAVVALSRELSGELVNLSYLAGFPPADLFWCGPAVIAHAWTQAAADQAADTMLREITRREGEFAEPMLKPAAAIRRALARAGSGRPVVLADTQDNPGCGGTADSTGVIEALLAAGAAAVVGYLCDAEAARAAHAAGEGASLDIALGGRSGPEGVTPVAGPWRVLRLGSGRMTTSGKVSGGREIDLGKMALLEKGGVEVAVTSKRMQALDQEPFRHLGIEPAAQKLLVLKSTCHFRAEFEPIAEEVIVVEAPGYYLADPVRYPFRRLRPGVRLHPLGPDHRGPADLPAC